MPNEMRLIDANELLNKFWLLPGHIRKNEMDLIRDAPTVVAVPVVRCKDCKHWGETNYGCECSFHSEKENQDYPAFSVQMLPNDFCSYGERRNDG